jgi:hypothetical protein
MDIKLKICDIRTWQKHLFLDISPHQHWYTCPIALPMRPKPQHRSLWMLSTSAPPFQPLRHQRNVCHTIVNRLTRQTLPTVNRKHIFMNIHYTESFCPQKTYKRTLLFGNILKHDGHFDYWNQPLNMRMLVCYLNCHEAGLCCYLVIHIENLLRPLHLFYSHLCLCCPM